MNLDLLKTTFKTALLKWTVSKIDVATIRTLLSGTLELLKAKAETTENRVDDAVIADMEYLINNGELLEALVTWLKSKLTKQPSSVCESCAEMDDEIAELARKICKQPDGVCESSAAVTVIIQILQAVLPLIVSYLTSTQEDPKE